MTQGSFPVTLVAMAADQPDLDCVQVTYVTPDTSRAALSEYVAHLSALMALSAGGEVACDLNLVADISISPPRRR